MDINNKSNLDATFTNMHEHMDRQQMETPHMHEGFRPDGGMHEGFRPDGPHMHEGFRSEGFRPEGFRPDGPHMHEGHMRDGFPMRDTSTSMPEAPAEQPHYIMPNMTGMNATMNTSLAMGKDNEKRKEREKEAPSAQVLTARLTETRRDFSANSLRDQLSQRLQQPASTMPPATGKTLEQPTNQAPGQTLGQGQPLGQQTGTEQTTTANTTDQFQAPAQPNQTSSPGSQLGQTGRTANPPTALGTQPTGAQQNQPQAGVPKDASKQPSDASKLTPRQFPSPLGGQTTQASTLSPNTTSTLQGKPEAAPTDKAGNNSNSQNANGEAANNKQPSSSDGGRMTPRQFPSPLPGRSAGMPPSSMGNPNNPTSTTMGQAPTNPTSSQSPLMGRADGSQPGMGKAADGTAGNMTDSMMMGKPMLGADGQASPRTLPGMSPNGVPASMGQMGLPSNGQGGAGSTMTPGMPGQKQPTDPAMMGKQPVSGFQSPLANTKMMGTATPAQSEVEGQQATNVGVFRPVSMMEDKTSTRQTSMAGNEREQIKMALATMFPTFPTLPLNAQSAIVDIYMSHPNLPLEQAAVFIQLTETPSFQQLGTSDRQLVMKLFGSMMESPMFNNNSGDSRLSQLLSDVANGMMGLNFYREANGKPGMPEATGMSLNLASPETASAIADALKGDVSKLAKLMMGLAGMVPEVRNQDSTWNSLMAEPNFSQLGDAQAGVYQAVKQFPTADKQALIQYAAIPSAQFAQASPTDQANQLKLVAAIDSSKDELGHLAKDSSPAIRADGGKGSVVGQGDKSDKAGAGQVSGGQTSIGQASTGEQLMEHIQEDTVQVELYRASDGKKMLVEDNKIKLNIADPSVQRSLATDGKLVASAVARLSGNAIRALDGKVAELENKPTFKKLDSDTKRIIASATKDYPNADAETLSQFAQSFNFQDNKERDSKNGREFAYTMRIVASMLHQNANNPQQLNMIYNSLQRILANDTQFQGFTKDTKYAASNEKGGVSMNSKWIENEAQNAATFVGEVNHALHERPNINWGGTIAVFANEYRSAYTEMLFRTNDNPEPEHMQQFMAGLLNTKPSSVYAHIRNTYDSDGEFTKLVDWINTKLEDKEVVKPEELRQVLLGMVGKTPNIASEEPFQQSWFVDNTSPFPDASAVLAQVAKQLPLDRLSKKEQSVVINMVRKYEADPHTFSQLMQMPTFQQASDDNRLWMLRVAGSLSASAAQEGKGSPVQRTLSQVLSGRTEIQFYDSESDARLSHLTGNKLQINLSECRPLLIDDWVAGLNDSLVQATISNKR